MAIRTWLVFAAATVAAIVLLVIELQRGEQVNDGPFQGALQGAASQEESDPWPVAREDFGDAWPLTVERGTIVRKKPFGLVFMDPQGKEYGLNGIAINAGYPPIDLIWAPNPEIEGTYKNIGALIDPALEHFGMVRPPARSE